MDPVRGSIPVFHPIFQPQGIPSVPEPFPPIQHIPNEVFFHEKSWKTLCPKAQVSPIPAGNKSQIPTPLHSHTADPGKIQRDFGGVGIWGGIPEGSRIQEKRELPLWGCREAKQQ